MDRNILQEIKLSALEPDVTVVEGMDFFHEERCASYAPYLMKDIEVLHDYLNSPQVAVDKKPLLSNLLNKLTSLYKKVDQTQSMDELKEFAQNELPAIEAQLIHTDHDIFAPFMERNAIVLYEDDFEDHRDYGEQFTEMKAEAEAEPKKSNKLLMIGSASALAYLLFT